jgi:hypothetical protein
MARSRNLLERFRPAGTPGAAARPGVPADRVAELTAELEPVLVLLDDAVQEARATRAKGRRRAERVRRQAEEQSHALLAQARRDAEAERSAAAVRVTEQAAAEAAAELAAAQEEAEEVRRRGAELMPAYVDRVLGALRDELATARAEGAST